MPRPCADKQKIMGLTALPVPTMIWSSDPMIPKAVVRTDHFAEEQSDVLSRNRT